jgi:hypothetical protein
MDEDRANEISGGLDADAIALRSLEDARAGYRPIEAEL